MTLRYEPCPNCGTPRDTDHNQACPLCGSRKYPLFGYSYAHEARSIMVMLIVIAALIICALLAGISVFVWMQLQLSNLFYYVA